jgi:hypothetical protein
MGMSRIQVEATHPHTFPLDEARRRLERAMEGLAADFPGYGIQRKWADEAKMRLTFTFAKAGKGDGGGAATLEATRVAIALDAEYNLPFLVPVALAQKLVRDSLAKRFAEAFA